MEDCATLISNLKTVLRNLKKGPNQKYRAQTLKNKLKTSQDTYNKIIDLISDLEDEKSQKTIATSARQLLEEIIAFINTRLGLKPLISFKTVSLCVRIFLTLYSKHCSVKISPSQIKMAKVDVKLGASLISVYDGNPDNLDTFIDAATFFIDYVNTENESATPTVIEAAKRLTAKFLKTRLTGIAHRSVQGIETVTEIFAALRLQCASKVNSDNLLPKLKNYKEKQSLESFCNEVEQTCALLQNMFIKESIPQAKAAEMSTKAGVNTLINGVRNPDTKLILKAGNFSNLNQAVQKALENATSNDSHQSNIYYINNRSRYSNAQRSGRYSRGRPNNFQTSRNNNSNNSGNQRSNFRRRNDNFRNNSNNTNFNNGTNNGRNFNSSTHNRRNWNSSYANRAGRQFAPPQHNNVLVTETQLDQNTGDTQAEDQSFLSQNQRQFTQ